MDRRISFVTKVALVVVLAGCAFGKKMTFESKEIDAGNTVYKPVAVVFHDQRPEVLAGREKPSYCGHSNSTGQIGYNIQTASGKPLASEFTNALVASLVKRQITAEALMMPHSQPADSVLLAFKNGKMERLLFFTIALWDATMRPKFSTVEYQVVYDLDLKVYNREGAMLANSHTKDFWRVEDPDLATSNNKLQRYADSVFVKEIRSLLRDPKVQESVK
jgi:hypothetical protein